MGDGEDNFEDIGDTPVRRRKAPRAPSEKEKETHEVTHLPYRDWCGACVQGRGKATPHYSKVKEESKKEVVSLYYVSMGSDVGDKERNPT